ncbi:hypothetical protein, partial [Hoylesella pleuritidis]|uniref:hypothetical protein n=1 Tax=Hoylesella pleuritidis TaxID=407975 RepID=UPI0028EDD869
CNNKYLIFSYAREERRNLYREKAYKKSFLPISCIFLPIGRKRKKIFILSFFDVKKERDFCRTQL